MYVVVALRITENHYIYTRYNDSQHNDTQRDTNFIVSLYIHGLIAALSIHDTSVITLVIMAFSITRLNKVSLSIWA